MDRITTIVIAVIFSLVGSGMLVLGLSDNNEPQQNLGALTGPDILSGYLHWGAGSGKYFYPSGMSLTAATTTPCDITSPVATSSLTRLTFQTTAATGTALTWRVATSTRANATTTTLAYGNFDGVTAVSYIASTSATSIFAANTHIVVGIEGTGYGPTLSGSCTAEWTLL